MKKFLLSLEKALTARLKGKDQSVSSGSGESAQCLAEKPSREEGVSHKHPLFLIPAKEVIPISYQAIFGNSNPVEIEIGCGKGKFLLARAEELPEINFLGIDRVGKWMKRRMVQRDRKSLTNLFFMKTEAEEFLAAVPHKSVSVFHIYFPDPWPKRRHHRRRLLTPDFLTQLHRRLKPGGLIEIATDHEDYWPWIQSAATATVSLWQARRESINERICAPHLKTNYELKFESAGKSLFYLELRKAGEKENRL